MQLPFDYNLKLQKPGKANLKKKRQLHCRNSLVMGTSVLKRQSSNSTDGVLTISKTAVCARKPGQRKRARS